MLASEEGSIDVFSVVILCGQVNGLPALSRIGYTDGLLSYNNLGDNHKHLLLMFGFQLYATDLKIFHQVTSLLIQVGKGLIRGPPLIGSELRQNRLQEASD